MNALSVTCVSIGTESADIFLPSFGLLLASVSASAYGLGGKLPGLGWTWLDLAGLGWTWLGPSRVAREDTFDEAEAERAASQARAKARAPGRREQPDIDPTEPKRHPKLFQNCSENRGQISTRPRRKDTRNYSKIDPKIKAKLNQNGSKMAPWSPPGGLRAPTPLPEAPRRPPGAARGGPREPK